MCVAYHPSESRRARFNFSLLPDTHRHDVTNAIGGLESISKTQQFRNPI